MRRKYILGSLTLLLIGSLAVAWIVKSPKVPPQQVIAKQLPDENGATSLPLAQVVLFSSGVGYFQREGEVDGNARIDLQFPIGDVNDLLKSLVLHDSGKGKIGAISYDGQDPVDKTLRSFSVDLTGNPTFGQVLNQARGEKVEVVMQQTVANQPGTLTGVVMGMESEMQTTGPGASKEVHMINLLCAEGVRAVNLREVQRIRFLNPKMESELRKALDVLAASHDALKKQVSMNFKGEGKRKVKVGYVAENPIWKTTYRLSVDDVPPEGKGPNKLITKLQGWAAVENVTDEDWNDVRIVLVSGRPISFQMDMYPPLFVPRPVVEPEKFASLRPPQYGGALTRGRVEDMMAGNTVNPNFNMPQGQLGSAGQGGLVGIGGGFGGGGFNGLPGTFNGAQSFGGGQLGQQGGNSLNFNNDNNRNRYQMNSGQFNPNLTSGQFKPQGFLNDPNPNVANNVDGNNSRLNYEQFQQRKQQQQAQMEQAKAEGQKIANPDPHHKLASDAASEEMGGYVRYVIEDKISLPRQKSALLPLLDKSVQASRVCIFNESVHTKFPVLGLRVKNTTGQPLTQGPITVYEADTYAGDARLPDLQPNEERLISYAIDLGTEVKAETTASPSPAMQVMVLGDKMHVSYKSRETKKYTIKNRSTQDRIMVIEHPVREGWDLAKSQKPRETTRDMYRFDVPVAAGQDLVFEVAEEQDRNDLFAQRPVMNRDGLATMHYAAPSLELHVELATRPATPELVGVKLVKGNVVDTHRQRVSQHYRVYNQSQKDAREITLKHRVAQDWKIVDAADPKAAATQAKDFTLKLATGKDSRISVESERELSTQWVGSTMLTTELEKLLAHTAVTANVKAALRKILDRRNAIEDQKTQVADLEKRLKDIGEEQDRLRKNISNLPPTSAAHKRYLEKFDKQETEIESLQDSLKKLKETEKRQQKELTDMLAGLNAE